MLFLKNFNFNVNIHECVEYIMCDINEKNVMQSKQNHMIHLNLLLKDCQMKSELSLMRLVIKKLMCERNNTARKSIVIANEMKEQYIAVIFVSNSQ